VGKPLRRRPWRRSPDSAYIGRFWTVPGGRWLLVVLSLELVLSLSILLPLCFGFQPWGGRDFPARVATFGSILVIPLVLHGVWILVRQQGRERLEASVSRAANQEISARLDRLHATRTLVTAFQPICDLGTGEVIGAEALTRFVSSPVRSPDQWFAEAEAVGRGVELEFLALETALLAAVDLPAHLYVAVNLSPAACLDARLGDIVGGSRLEPGRIVVELTERSAVVDYARLNAALAPLRSAGVRIAIDDACDGYSSMRHILRLSPELVKMDRTIVAGIDEDANLKALCSAMVGFASQIGAGLIAEGIETDAELVTITGLGVNAGQGYLLGRPSVLAADWIHWRPRNRTLQSGNDDSHGN
jgi:EAL domain-containing protein (putative c-di-GMP-specific phosphodiesterase class I)